MMLKVPIAHVLVSLLVLHLAADSNETGDAFQVATTFAANPPPQPKIACVVRCSKSLRPNLCHRACGTCCTRCNCVPPDTFNNYDVCPCYRDMTTREGKHKCP
ncbi:gibberellin-regulated protein 11-like [Pyrus ussuriensis x Pyrus communis]|uniref:Gibberellin-regulated protein 11-like n=1 Tax=Pyrus ussuriensis x Pyrus communis TaxID=2448454 RepID=A0A5N5HRU0_9ROSA|nr:gibberellin-regulated protein 11-like [Pyrus ussuriensis x Pyrus communis]